MRFVRYVTLLLCSVSILAAQQGRQHPTVSNGASSMRAGNATINATIGQAIIGTVSKDRTSASQGAWFVPLAPAADDNTTTPALNAAADQPAFTVSPHPVVSSATVAFTPTCNSTLRAQLFSLSGKLVLDFTADAPSRAGVPTLFTLNASDIANGTYSLRILSECDSRTFPIIISK